MNTRIPGGTQANRAERRRLAKQTQRGNVVSMTPNIAAASERLRRAKLEGPKSAYPARDGASQGAGFESVEFTIYDAPTQVVIDFARKVKYIAMSPEKARKLAQILIETAARIEDRPDENASDSSVNTDSDK